MPVESNPAADAEFDIAIVGFGPVGQLLALLLGRNGHRVLVLERWQQPYDRPRAVHFDHEIGRIFQAAGIAKEVMAITDPVQDFYEWRNALGDSLVRIDWSGIGLSGWPTANFFSQPDLERVLAAAAEAVPSVTVLRGHQVVGLAEHAEGVEIESRTESEDTRKFHARWVIGADGANSFVRDRMPGATTDRGFPGNTTIERHTVYTFQARWADTWRAGRLLLAGDAAHLMPPFAGQGICPGYVIP
jgi:flavoprotein hydroxylase